MGFVAQKLRADRVVDEMMEAARSASRASVIDLALGDPDLPTDPRIIEATHEDVKDGHTHYAPARGDVELVEAIRESWSDDLGASVSEDNILVTASGCHAMWLLLTAIVDPGDEVIIFSPYFSPYPEQIRLAGGTPIEVATTADQGFFVPQAHALEAAISSRTKAVIVNSPANPTGAVLSGEQIDALLRVCEKHDLLYIADDIYTAYDFARPFVAAATRPQATERVASVRSFSKDFCMSGWRIGYVVAPSDIISAMLTVNESNVYVAPTVSQRAAYHALGLRKEITQEVHRVYQQRMEYVAQRVASISYLDLPTPDGSLYAFIDIRATGETSTSFTAKLLEKHRVSVIPGTAFGASGEGFIRMALRQDIPVLASVFDTLAHEPEWTRD